MALSLWASFGVALGLHPESALQLDFYAPCAALFVAAWWSGQSHKKWWSGVWLSLFCIGFWMLAHLYLTTRFSSVFLGDALTQLTPGHFLWWSVAILLGALGGFCGARFSSRAMGTALCIFVLLGMWSAQIVWSLDSFHRLQRMDFSDGGPFLGENESGKAELIEPQADGTTIHLLRFDLKKIDLGLYDADEDDATPFDDKNATWLGQPLRRVAQKITRRDGRAPLCVVNGGFFGNLDPWIAIHEAPVSRRGDTHYNSTVLQTDWPEQIATLVWKSENGATRLQIERRVAFEDLAGFSGALGGVRVLRESGKDATLAPGMGGSTLKCSRTSVGFDSHFLWILSVRDPDGEASSVRANRWEKAHPEAPKIQVGGWDVKQVQRFWRDRKIPSAVLFDGGESAQLGADYGNGLNVVHSSFHFSRTPGFLNRKPLRVVLPMLPPDAANGGVLNWFFVAQRKTK